MAALDFSQFASQPSFGERYAQGQQQSLQNKLTEQQNQMQMRSAQNQNALAQYQLSSAQREDASTNALNTAYQNAYDPATGKIDSARLLQSLASNGAGSKILGVQKALMDAEIAQLNRQKLQGEVNAQPGDAAYKAAQTGELNEKTLDLRLLNFNKRFSPLSVNGPDDVRAYTVAMYNDPELGPLATRIKSLDEALQTNLAEFARDPNMWIVAHSNVSGKDILETLKGTRRDVNLGSVSRGSTVNAFGNVVPGSQVDTSIGATPSTAAAMQSAAAATSNAATSAGQLKVAQDRLAQEKIGSTAVPVQDPNNPSQMILVNPRQYKGGGLGAPGVIGLTGKTPAATAKQEAADKGIAQVASVIDDLRANYNTLNAARAIPSTERSALSNLTSSARSSSLGQFSGRVFGTEEQSARDVINSSRLMLLNGIKQATGLSATQLNSNMELTTWLKAVSDPSQSIETVDKILGNIEKFIATGGKYSAKKDDKMAAPPAAAASASAGVRFLGFEPGTQ